MLVPIKDIRIGKRLRALRETTVADLVESIARMGLQTPISVATGIAKREGGGADLVAFDLVTGHHRLEACRRLGWDDIEAAIVQMADDDLELWEIDENLCRADLTELERAEHLARRKEIYLRKYPQTGHGGDRKSAAAIQDAASGTLKPFHTDTAEKIGIGASTIQHAIRRVVKIDEKVRDRIRDNPEIADNTRELDALAAMEPQLQRKAVALVESGQAVGIRDAKKLMEPKQQKVAPNFKTAEREREARQTAFAKALWKLTPEDREWAEQMLSEFFDKPIADSTSALRVVS